MLQAIEQLRSSLPEGIVIQPTYMQKSFIERAIDNIKDALRDGILLVIVILYVFLMNFRTTIITVTAIPLSLFATAVIFAVLGFSINTMTLGGIAVAIGELVDDAIVDVENIFRRLKENQRLAEPLHPLQVVYRASSEVRRSIVFSTAIVIVVFLPLFFLEGMEGKLFVPLGVAYIVSILSSLVISLTVTPILSYWLLGNSIASAHRESYVLKGLKYVAERVIRLSLTFPVAILMLTLLFVGLAGVVLSRLERDFLPQFNEGTVQLNVVLPPGTSLETSNQVSAIVESSLMKIPDLQHIVRRTGRAELDEHAEGVNLSEFLIELNPTSRLSRAEQLDQIRLAMLEIPGITTSVEQPIAHLISHMLSGVKAQIGIKLYGDDLDLLRVHADRIKRSNEGIQGVQDLMVEPQTLIPQLRIELEREKLTEYGLKVDELNDFIQTAMNGTVVSQVLEGTRTYDLIVRIAEEHRMDIELLKRLPIKLPTVGWHHWGQSPTSIKRQDRMSSIVRMCNAESLSNATLKIAEW